MKFAAMLAIVATAAAASAASDVQPVVDLLHRVLPSHADLFALELAPARAGAVASFTVAAAPTKGHILITGSDVSALAAGVLDYLNSVNASVSWAATGGDNLVGALPPPSAGLPAPPAPRERDSPFARRYVYNTCTYGYSTVWWDWARWERELDWMALHSINTPLSMLGTEWVWRETFVHDFGLARSDLDDFFPGPAYLP